MAKAKKTIDPDAEEAQSRMTFGDHLEELRKRIIYALLGSLAGIAVCLYYSKDIVTWLLRPYRLALKNHYYAGVFDFDKPASVVLSYIGIGLKAGLIVSSPWIIYQFWLFVGAGLYHRERRTIYRYIGPSSVLFLLGIAFFYYLVLPLSLNFFIGFTDNTALDDPVANKREAMIMNLNADAIDLSKIPPGDKVDFSPIPIVRSDPPKPPDGGGYLFFNAADRQIKFKFADKTLIMLVVLQGSLFVNTPRFDDYLSFITITGLIFGAAFEMPMVIMILAQIGIVSPKTFRDVRKYTYFGLSIASAVAAPSSDILTMLCLMVPLIVLYEVGIIAASIVVRRQEKRAEESENES